MSSAFPDGLAGDNDDLCAVLVLDAAGKVVAANLSARRLWAVKEPTLVGRLFTQLIHTEGTRAGSDDPEAQWRQARFATSNRWTKCQARPLGGAESAVEVRTEPAQGGAGSFIATIRRPASGR